MPKGFDLQGHRGARGLSPENTLPSFERALDEGVTSIETDLHLTADGEVVLYHDPHLGPDLCRRLPRGRVPAPKGRPLIASLTRDQLNHYCADQNPDRSRFGRQCAVPTPLTWWFAEFHAFHPFGIPSLEYLLEFLLAYAEAPGRMAGKTPKQRRGASQVRLDLELKRVPFHPELIGDGFDGTKLGALEKAVLDIAVAKLGVERVAVRSFDHRAVQVVTKALPGIGAGVLIAETAPMDPPVLASAAGADTYCPDYRFLDEAQVRRCHAAGIRVVPWTVNEEADWKRLLAWKVDGITTDEPDRLAAFLKKSGPGLR